MRCFEFGEKVFEGIFIRRFPEPHVPTKGRVRLLLDPKMRSLIKKLPATVKGDALLQSATLMHQDSGRRILLAPEPPEWRDDKALVWVVSKTHGGTIGLTASIKDGARIVGGCEAPIRLQDGVTKLEVLVELSKKGSFVVKRTGQNAGPEVAVYWDGVGLEAHPPTVEEPIAMDSDEPESVLVVWPTPKSGGEVLESKESSKAEAPEKKESAG